MTATKAQKKSTPKPTGRADIACNTRFVLAATEGERERAERYGGGIWAPFPTGMYQDHRGCLPVWVCTPKVMRDVMRALYEARDTRYVSVHHRGPSCDHRAGIIYEATKIRGDWHTDHTTDPPTEKVGMYQANTLFADGTVGMLNLFLPVNEIVSIHVLH